jgi:hypothetical protein
MTTVCTTSPTSVGGTFVDWSMHWLSGQSQHWQCDTNQWHPLVTDPLRSVNAHNHPRNYVAGSQHLEHCLQLARSQTGLLTFYFLPTQAHLAAKALGLTVGTNTQQKVIHQQLVDQQKSLELIQQHQCHLVYIDYHPSLRFYHTNSRNPVLHSNGEYCEDQQTLRNDIDHAFFQDSVDQWTALGLTDVWDIRERMALNMRPFSRQDLQNFKDLGVKQKHFWIDCQQLWYDGKNVMIDLLNHVGLDLDQSRLAEWDAIYAKWQQIQIKHLKFDYVFDHIIDCIINNIYYELPKLTLEQEAAIQHTLIYKYSLNFKTWNLKQFPNNTQDLHNLLEANIHQVEQLY